MEGDDIVKLIILMVCVLVNTESEEVEGDDIVKLIILMVCVLVNTESEEVEGDDIVKLIILMDPGQYRNIEQLIKDETQVIFYINQCFGFRTSCLIFCIAL